MLSRTGEATSANATKDYMAMNYYVPISSAERPITLNNANNSKISANMYCQQR